MDPVPIFLETTVALPAQIELITSLTATSHTSPFWGKKYQKYPHWHQKLSIYLLLFLKKRIFMHNPNQLHH